MEKKVVISILCQIYGKILTEKQYTALNDYYNNDLSLSEIAENLEITRQAVRDNILQAEKKLYEYEEKLKLVEKKTEQEEKQEKLLSKIERMKKKQTDAEMIKLLNKIQKDIKNLNS